MQEFIKSKLSIAFVSFLMGSTLTFFGVDYYQLKFRKNTQVNSHPLKVKKNVTSTQAFNPWKQMDDMDKRMDRILKNGFFSSGLAGQAGFNAFENDELDIQEREDQKYKYIEVQASGIDEDALKVDIKDGMITISGKIEHKDQNNSGNSQYHSTSISTFSRSFNIPFGVDESGVSFDKRDDGITIKFPKRV